MSRTCCGPAACLGGACLCSVVVSVHTCICVCACVSVYTHACVCDSVCLVSVCMVQCVCPCVSACRSVYVSVYTCVCICLTCLCVYCSVCTRVSVYVCMSLCVHARVDAYVCMSVSVCMRVCTRASGAHPACTGRETEPGGRPLQEPLGTRQACVVNAGAHRSPSSSLSPGSSAFLPHPESRSFRAAAEDPWGCALPDCVCLK